MADFKLSAAVVLISKQATDTQKELEEGFKKIEKSAGQTGRKSSLSLKAMTNDMMKLGAIGSGAFAMMMNASPALASAFDSITFSIEELFMILGDRLAPLIEEHVVPIVEMLVEGFASLDPEVQTAIAVVIGFAALLLPLSIGIGVVSTALGVLLGPIGLVILAIAALWLAWEMNLGNIQGHTSDTIKMLTDMWKSFVSDNSEEFARLFDNIKEFWDNIRPIVNMIADLFFTHFQGKIAVAIKYVMDVISAFTLILNGVLDVINGIFAGDWGRVWQGVQDIVRGIFNYFAAGINAMIGNLNNIINTIENFVNKIPGVDWNAPSIPLIPTLHEGGVFHSSSGQEGLAFLKNNERVRTATQERGLQRQLRDNSRGGGSGGLTLIFNNPSFRERRDIQDLVRQIDQIQKREAQRRSQYS